MQLTDLTDVGRQTMTGVPYTATYQSWQPQHFAGFAEQHESALPGFDEQEKQALTGCTWQYPVQSSTYMPPGSDHGHYAASHSTLQNHIRPEASVCCYGQQAYTDAYEHSGSLPAVHQDCVDHAYHSSVAATGPSYGNEARGYAANRLQISQKEEAHGLGNTLQPALAGKGSQCNIFQEPAGTELQCDYGVALGWPASQCAGWMPHLSSPDLGDTCFDPDIRHAHVAAVLPEQLQQKQASSWLQNHTSASQSQADGGQPQQSLHLQEGCSTKVRSPIPALNGAVDVIPQHRACSVGITLGSAQKTSILTAHEHRSAQASGAFVDGSSVQQVWLKSRLMHCLGFGNTEHIFWSFRLSSSCTGAAAHLMSSNWCSSLTACQPHVRELHLFAFLRLLDVRMADHSSVLAHSSQAL